MVVVDGGQSAIVFGCCDDPSPVMKLFCDDNNDPGQCKWKPLEFSLPFEAYWPVSLMIPNEIVPDCE